MKRALLALCLLGIWAPGPVVNNIRNQTVLLGTDRDKNWWVCTGVLIYTNGTDHAFVLTAEHCTGKPMYARLNDGTTGKVLDTRAMYHGKDDVRMLLVQFSRDLPAKNYIKPVDMPAYGQKLIVAGFNGSDKDLDLHLQRALYVGAQVTDDGNKQWYNTVSITCPQCKEGDSGGGVWDQQGNLLGIMDSADEDYGAGFYLPIKQVYKDIIGGQ